MQGVVWGLSSTEIDSQTVRHGGYLQVDDCRWGRICAPVELRTCVEPQGSHVITGVLRHKRLNKEETSATQANKIFINVSSQLYETYAETLERFPNTLLGCSETRRAYYKTETKQYCLGWRNLSSFNAILFYYQSNGILSRPVDVDPQTFYKEIRFFELGEGIVQRFLDREGLTINTTVKKTRALPGGRMWQLLEYPNSSRLAKAFAVLSWLLICLSLVVFCGETLPRIRENATKKNAFNNLEITCVACFTLEYWVRLAFAPNRRKFVLSAMGCIDFLAFAPFFVTAIMTALDFNTISERLCCFVPVLKLLRVVRVLKFSRYVHGMNILGKILVQSSKELVLLLLCLVIGSIFFASLAYLADFSEADTQIPSIPDGIWFILISLTNVGYGDIVPVSNLGKLNAGICVIVGIIVMSIPVPVIIRNFTTLYRLHMKN